MRHGSATLAKVRVYAASRSRSPSISAASDTDEMRLHEHRRSDRSKASGLVLDAAGSRWRRDNEPPVHDLGANRRGSPGAVCLLAFCAGRLRGAERQYGDERQEKARADTEPVAAKPHPARMASGHSSRIGRPTHLQLRRDLFFVDVERAKAGRRSPTKSYVGFVELAGVRRKRQPQRRGPRELERGRSHIL